MRIITSFQKKCLRKLLEYFQKQGIASVNYKLINGKEEKYYKVETNKYLMWIYEDMADIKGRNNNFARILEPQDFNSDDELISKFVEVVSSVCK